MILSRGVTPKPISPRCIVRSILSEIRDNSRLNFNEDDISIQRSVISGCKSAPVCSRGGSIFKTNHSINNHVSRIKSAHDILKT